MRLIHASVFSLTGVVILYTGSLQGLILYLFNLLLVLCWYLYSAKIIRIPRPKIFLLTTSIAFIVIFFFVIAVIENLPSNFVSKVDSAIQFRSRLDHWKLGIRVGQDNFWTGVGIDNLLSHSALYITKEMAQGYQGIVLTDKTHNVFIDHFANGGIFAVISWLIFTVLVSSFALKTMFFIQKSSNIAAMLVLFGIWMTYTIQTLISPDHLYLILIGMVSSGALVGISVNNKAPKILNGNSDQ
jgi:O-antigen ligase